MFDDATNYGAIGIIMGHEMTHAFDDSGRHFDGYGALTDWWTAPDAKNFNARAACVSNQFDQFVIGDGVHANGPLELGEAIADLGGANLPIGRSNARKIGKPRRTIDGFTPEQRFFLGFATFQTEEDRLEYASSAQRANRILSGRSASTGHWQTCRNSRARSHARSSRRCAHRKNRCQIW